jgi:hypothetical protein
MTQHLSIGFASRGPSMAARTARLRRNVAADLASRQVCTDLVRAYAPYGGVADADALALRLRRLHRQPLSLPARWIVAREVVCFQDRGVNFLPNFEFDEATLLPRPSVRRVVRELRNVCENLDLAQWFVSSNPSLEALPPVAVIDAEPDRVLEAARADRFLASW